MWAECSILKRFLSQKDPCLIVKKFPANISWTSFVFSPQLMWSMRQMQQYSHQFKNMHTSVYMNFNPCLRRFNKKNIILHLPYSIEGRDGMLPLPFDGLASDKILCKMVGQFTGLPHQSLVLQIRSRYLFVDILETYEEGPMSKPLINERATGRHRVVWLCITFGNLLFNTDRPHNTVLRWVVVTVETAPQPSTTDPYCRPAAVGGVESDCGGHRWGFRGSRGRPRSAGDGSPIESAPQIESQL